MTLKNNRSLLILSGNTSDITALDLSEYKYFFPVDGGAEFTFKHSLTPELILGDLDSITQKTLSYYKENGFKIKKYNSDKDYSDTELMLMYIKENYPDITELDVIGSFSTFRIDHYHTNINVFTSFSDTFSFKLINKDFTGYIFSRKIDIDVLPDQFLSFISLSQETNFKKSTGLEYSLNGLNIKRESSIGLSNKTKTSHINVVIQDGICFLILPRPE